MTSSAFYQWRHEAKDRINNALVLFDSPDVVQAILEKSSDRGSFWSTQSLFAYPLQPSYYEIFYENIYRQKGIVRRLANLIFIDLGLVSHSSAKFSKSSSSCKRWGREIPPHISRPCPDPTGNEPPAKRPRKEGATKPTPGGMVNHLTLFISTISRGHFSSRIRKYQWQRSASCSTEITSRPTLSDSEHRP